MQEAKDAKKHAEANPYETMLAAKIQKRHDRELELFFQEKQRLTEKKKIKRSQSGNLKTPKSHKSQLSIISKSKTNKSQSKIKVRSPSTKKLKKNKISEVYNATPSQPYKSMGSKVVGQNKLLQKKKSKSSIKEKKHK